MYHLILAEDHVMVRHGIRKIIEELPDVSVVGEASDGGQLLELLRHQYADMVILDISMPVVPGIEATRRIKQTFPGTRVLILTMHKKKEYLEDAVSAGADGYLLKEDAPRELLSAITAIRQGGIYISPLLSGELADLYVQNRRQGSKPQEVALSDREMNIVRLIAEGKSSKEIAQLLDLSFRTIQNHRNRMLRKLHLKKTTDLVKYAIQKGYAMTEPE